MNAFSLLTAAALLLPGLTAQQCTTTHAGAGCGPLLVVTFSPHGASGGHFLELEVSGLTPRALGIMVWGTQNFDVPIPGGCPLHTEFLWGHFFQTDATGYYKWQRAWPRDVLGGYFMQMGDVVEDAMGGLIFHTSNCEFAACN
ncbi:MAG: hypothetical protein R3F29_01685 [Planctomycetota bacterium]